jgi:uncharacterized protein YndB with AHSA1/START domain
VAQEAGKSSGDRPFHEQDVEVRVLITARPETIFRFFSDSERYRLWMGPESSIQPRKDGELVVRHGPGPAAVGRIVEWVANERLVFTWGHRSGEGGETVPEGSTTVTITLHPTDEGTLVTLRHTGLPTEIDRQGHRAGWRYYLSQLSAVSWTERMAGRCEPLVDSFFRAWSESDGAARLNLLNECWAEEGRHRDRYGCIDGREALHGYIGGVLMMTQGAKIGRSGPVEQVHAFLRCPWKITLPNGATMATGINVFELNRDGLLQSCVGFGDAPPST